VVLGRFETNAETITNMNAALLAMQLATVQEAGCLDYQFSAELNDPTFVRLTERWVDLASLQAHFQAPHMAIFRDAMKQNPPRSSSVTFYKATEIKL